MKKTLDSLKNTITNQIGTLHLFNRSICSHCSFKVSKRSYLLRDMNTQKHSKSGYNRLIDLSNFEQKRHFALMQKKIEIMKKKLDNTKKVLTKKIALFSLNSIGFRASYDNFNGCRGVFICQKRSCSYATLKRFYVQIGLFVMLTLKKLHFLKINLDTLKKVLTADFSPERATSYKPILKPLVYVGVCLYA